MFDLLRKAVYGIAPYVAKGVYVEDSLVTTHNHDFVNEWDFELPYDRGVAALPHCNHHLRWRVHVALWAARTAAKLTGDFVECGVSHGMVSSAIMYHLRWDSLDKTFYLLDRFDGFKQKGFYASDVEKVRENFSANWRNFRLIKGMLPGTLAEVDSAYIAFLHLDLNVPEIEVDVLQELWPRLVTGAMVLMDDYAYVGSDARNVYKKRCQWHHDIVSLPTGQGLLIKL